MAFPHAVAELPEQHQGPLETLEAFVEAAAVHVLIAVVGEDFSREDSRSHAVQPRHRFTVVVGVSVRLEVFHQLEALLGEAKETLEYETSMSTYKNPVSSINFHF
jgi:hypothetical protein